MAASSDDTREQRYQRLIEIGIAMSAERNYNRLLEAILLGAKDLAHADGGTLYLVSEDRKFLTFEILRNDTLGTAMGGTSGNPISLPPVPLYDLHGFPNRKNVSACAAVSASAINIVDAYDDPNFDFSGMKAFDAKMGYRSKSFLTVPLKNHADEVVGVLQLINALDEQGSVISFSEEVTPLVVTLASQAAMTLDNQMLLDAQKRLLLAFIQLLAGAIDAKSPYTGGHCRRVPHLTEMLAKAANDATSGPYESFSLNEEEWYELEVAAGLHDCGKVTTPEYVVDKATKLETIYNRIHEIRTRFEVVKRDVEITCLKSVIAGGDAAALEAERDAKLRQLDEDFAFVAECNVGGEFLAQDKIERLRKIGEATWVRTLDDTIGLAWEEKARKTANPTTIPCVERLLDDKPEHVIAHDKPTIGADNPWGFKIKVPPQKFNLGELYNLSITRGTLTAEDRFHINDHIVQTIIMLEALPFPKNLRQVPEIAGGHHEKMDGTGYPKGLKRDEMSIPARMMAIADIFEALTARDRPYKAPKKLSEALKIMSFMVKDRHIDSDLFQFFLTSGVYRAYAERYLTPDQLDQVDITQYFPDPAE